MTVKFRKIKIGSYILGCYYGQVTECEGITSLLTEDNHHVLFWDFTPINLDEIITILKNVQHKHNLGSIYIFQSGQRNSFRATCLDKFSTFEEAARIVMQTDCTDIWFIRYSLERQKFVIRISPKHGESNRLICTLLPSTQTPRSQSKAHLTILKALYPNIIITPDNWDNTDLLERVIYWTNLPSDKK